MLTFSDNHSIRCNMSKNPTLISVFGLLVQTPFEKADTTNSPSRIYQLDAYDIEEYGATSRLKCRCGRTPHEEVFSADLERAHRVTGFYGCPICQDETRQAKSPSDRIAIWFNQNKKHLNSKDHLYLPHLFQRLVDKDGTIMRPRRFIYSKFYNISLCREDKVLPTCNDKKCVNPYHMMQTRSPATKITPHMREDIYTWAHKNISNRSIQELLKAKYQKSVSLRTITNLKKSALV